MRTGILIGSTAAAITAFATTAAFAQTPTTTPQTGSSQPSVHDASKNPAQPPAGSAETKGNMTSGSTGMSGDGMSNGTMSKDGMSKDHMKKDGMSK
jgi:pentapeptide MXKDX repeat protein